jgi:uncharacterized protein
MGADYMGALAHYVETQTRPVDKFGHQPRLAALTEAIGAGLAYDRDVVLAAAWLHDLGVFIGHRPEDPSQLAGWDHVAYACTRNPQILHEAGFPEAKIAAVLDAIREHQAKDEPATMEATILRDADILEQLGAVGILRMVSKVGRDTRFPPIHRCRNHTASLPRRAAGQDPAREYPAPGPATRRDPATVSASRR